MTVINHERPVLKLIDDLKKERSTPDDGGPRLPVKRRHRPQEEKVAIHREAIECLQHVLKHRNVNVVAKFLSKEMCAKHQPALKMWFLRFGPVEFTKDDTIVFSRKPKASFSAAVEEPFWKFEIAKQQHPFDFVEELRKLVERADRKRVRPLPGDKIDLEALSKAREILRGR